MILYNQIIKKHFVWQQSVGVSINFIFLKVIKRYLRKIDQINENQVSTFYFCMYVVLYALFYNS